MIGVGFTGATADAAPLEEIRAFGPGAVILFGRNVGAAAELRALVGAVRETLVPPPLVLVDQEGGRVARIREGVAELPSAMAVGATNDLHLAEALGALLGSDLRGLGITVALAPVADLALQPRSTVIGTRAYGDDPVRVAAMAAAFARGLHGAGVAATFKHFPGHGATADDSHVALPRITVDAATLRARDLVPFAHGIRSGVASIVMSAHVVVEALDAQRPATLAPAVLTGLLRDALGFDGVIATDCLEMDAIARGVGTVRGAVEALAAGADLLLISHHLELAHAAADAIAAAVGDGEIALERLQDAHARVQRLRARLADARSASQPATRDAPLEAARRAVTVLRGDLRLDPAKPVTVISFEGVVVDRAATSGLGNGAAEQPSLSSMLRRRGWKSEVMRVPLDPAAEDVDLLLEHVRALGDRTFVIVTGDAHLFPSQSAAVTRMLAAAPDALVVSGRTPFDALLWPEAKTVACTYGTQPIALEGCADVMTGRATAAGTLPVRLTQHAAVR